MADRKAVRLTITGKVQGVWYRGWTEKTAKELGLFGWVRNREDGSVEALVVGLDAAVSDMVARCHEGPPDARVTAVDVKPAQGITPRRFEIKPTV